MSAVFNSLSVPTPVGRALRLAGAAAALLLALQIAFPSAAQTQGAASAKVAAPAGGGYRIAGTVTSSATGEPVRRATVSLVDETSRETLRQVETDDEGHFAIEGLNAEKFGLMAARRGYISAFFDEHDGYSSAIVTGDGQDTGHLQFHLTPGAMIHGVVTDDAGEPVQGAQVYLSSMARNAVAEYLRKPASTETDDTGAFEFWDLSPDTYFLAVKAKPWYALHRGGAKAGDTASAAALDVAYPVTYFDSATEEASATPIVLAGGAREEIGIPLHAVPALHLAVEAPSRRGGAMAQPELMQSIFGVPVATERVSPMDALRSGTAEFNGVAPGHYELRQGNPQRVSEFDASVSQQIDPSAGAPRASVTLKVRMADGSAPPQDLELMLNSDAANRRGVRAALGSAGAGRGSARFESVEAGTWTVAASSGALALAVASIETAGGPVKGSLIQVEDRPVAFTVTLVQGVTRIDGFVGKGGRGLAGVMVVLVPENPRANLELFRRDQSDSDGSFALRDAAPGKYTVIAIQDGWTLQWGRPEVIERYLLRGVAVRVTEKSGKAMRLPEPVPVQSR